MTANLAPDVESFRVATPSAMMVRATPV